MRLPKIIVIVVILTLATLYYPRMPHPAAADIPTVEWARLSEKEISPQGRLALSLDEKAWRHAETRHFIYHFQNLEEGETIYINAEAYYKWIAELFGAEEYIWLKKSHLFVFTDEKTWNDFKTRGNLSTELTAFTTGWELFLYRKPYRLAPKKSLAHEIMHIIMFRFLNGPVPLFLEEGFAEFVSYRVLALETEGDEYRIRIVELIPEEKFMPLKELTETSTYPKGKVETFYRESELLVRFLILNYDSKKFYALLRDVSKGKSFEKALNDIYDIDFETFEKKFKDYAVLSRILH